MADLSFIQGELTEARMFQKAEDVKGLSASNIAELVYLIFMLLQMIRQHTPSKSSSYAGDTMTYNTYDNMHYSGTDLANLLAVLNNQDTFGDRIMVDKGISIPLFQINRFLQAVRSSSKSSQSDDVTFFYKLENYIKISSNAAFRQMRRDIANWNDLSYSEKMRNVMILRQQFDRRGSNIDLYLWFKQSFRLTESVVVEGMFGGTSVELAQDFTNQLLKQFKLEGKSYLGGYCAPITVMLWDKLGQPKDFVPTSVIVSEEEHVVLLNNKGRKVIDPTGNQFDKPFYSEWDADYKKPHKLNANELQWAREELSEPSEETDDSPAPYTTAWFANNSKKKVAESLDLKLAYHNFLNPALWDDSEELKPDVKEALGKIANKFSEFVDVKQLKIVDYVITGSNCAYNYTSQSDIDLHILVDTTNLGDNPLTEPFLKAKKSLWNSGHDITVKGYTVELYAEDINDDKNQLIAVGIYSLLHDEWVSKPTYEKVSIDDYAVQSKAEDIMQQIDMLVDAKSQADSEEIAMLWDHIRKMRRAGLEREGEFSVENLSFKAIRNNGYLDKLRQYERSKDDKELSLEHQEIN